MSTLSNVATHGGESFPPSVRFSPGTIPKAKSSKTGVSVEYIPNANKQWYVFRASYRREIKANEIIVSEGEFTYLPMHSIKKIVNGKMRTIHDALIPNILFAYLTEEKAYEFVDNTPSLHFLSFYYNHFKESAGKNPPLIIPEDEMLNFIKATSVDTNHLLLLEPSQCHYKRNDIVEVLDGAFAGVRGKVVRVSGQQRVAVTLKGICTVATAYIPTAFLKIVSENSK